MFRILMIRAWKLLFATLAIVSALSYFTTVVLSWSGLVKPGTILRTTTFGIRHIGGPILDHGISIGIDQGVLIFFCNMTVALLILSIVCWVRLLNPFDQRMNFSSIRSRLQKDRTAEHLKKIPYFARINSSQLRLTAFMLLCVPFLVITILGLIIGTLLGSVQMLSSSPAVAFAYIMPHGIPEIAALLLTCSIPVGIWLFIQPAIDKQNPRKAFRRVRRMATSDELQNSIKMIINLLMIAGLIEAHLTLKVVALLHVG